MNRKLLMGAAFFCTSAGLAQADDLPSTYDTDWTGLYGTLSAGYSSVSLDGSQTEENTPIGAVTFEDSDRSRGGIAGIGAGFNYDLGGFVLGLDGDISLLSNENQLEMKNTVEVDYDWFATGRLRAGIDVGDTLLYGTGGIAFLRADFDDGQDDHSETFTGWTAGIGGEHMISDSWSVRLEILYADFGSEDFNLSPGFFDEIDTHVDADMFVIRTGISLRL